MKLKDIGSKVYKLIRETNDDDASDDLLAIKGEKITSFGKKMINLEMSDRFISIWIGNQKRKASPKDVSIDINLYVYNRRDESLWINAIIEPGHTVESRILSPKSVEYMCALNSMRSFIGDLFLIRPYDLRILEIMDLIGKKRAKSSIESYLRVLYKMIAND